MAYEIKDKRNKLKLFGYSARLDEIEHLALQTAIQKVYPFRRPSESDMIKDCLFKEFGVDKSTLDKPTPRTKELE